MAAGEVLSVNAGSSSVKLARFAPGAPPVRRWRGLLERLGRPDAALTLEPAGAAARGLPAGDGTVPALLARLEAEGLLDGLAAVGHRVVHGGPRLTETCWLDAAALAELRRIVPYDPEHLPLEIALVEAFGKARPTLPQIACFDTAFHRNLPRVAQLLPLPRRYFAAGLRRYGFHGLSLTYLVDALGEAARGRVILAHLGSGASLTAVRDGRSVDTTMAFTPNSGVPMGTRSGDLDPGLIEVLLRVEGLDAERLRALLTRESGLLGLSETSADVRDLLARAPADPRAAEALALFAYEVRKRIGALAAALGGLDTLVFSGGIGEHAAPVRAAILCDLEFLGIRLDEEQNRRNAPVLSAPESRVVVRLIPTDEEIVIARASLALLDTRSKETQS